MEPKVVVLHGLGQTNEGWEEVVDNLKFDCLAFNLLDGVQINSIVIIESVYSEVSKKLDEIEEPFYLCGLSLGGLLTLMYATRNNNPNMTGIIISGAIYKEIPKYLNWI